MPLEQDLRVTPDPGGGRRVTKTPQRQHYHQPVPWVPLHRRHILNRHCPSIRFVSLFLPFLKKSVLISAQYISEGLNAFETSSLHGTAVSRIKKGNNGMVNCKGFLIEGKEKARETSMA